MNEQLTAHYLVNRYPQKVIIDFECEHQDKKKVHHHYDYSKPFNIHLLCRQCHRALHPMVNKRKKKEHLESSSGANTSRKISALLAARGLTADKLAPILDLHVVTIYARMKNNSWTVEEINKIATAHNINPKELI